MIEINLPEFNTKQVQFLKSKVKHTGFGGARGGGKSFVTDWKSVLLAINYTGIKICIIRRTYPQLVENHIYPLQGIIPVKIAKYNGSEKTFKFTNGSRITCQYCNSDKDLENFQGKEYDVIFIDEATQLTEHQFVVIRACLRGVNDFPKRMYLTCNPGGRGHAWVKRIFIDKIYNADEKAEEYSFIQALVTDNKALMEKDPDYISQLDMLPESLKKGWRYGNWDLFEGQVFEEFRDNPKGYEERRWTHVIPAFDIPDGWRIYRSYDFGYSKPFSFGWWAVDYDGVIYRITEWYGCTKDPNTGIKWTPEQQFRHAREIEDQHPYLKGKDIQGVADPAIWKAETGESVADVAARQHIYFSKGDHERITGLMQVHYRLRFDENGYPMMYVFDTCKNFIRTIPELCYSETNPEDLDSDQEDHIYDETRYFCMSRPIIPRKPIKPEMLRDDPLNMIADMKKKRR